jgi:chromosome segregation ATPase
MSRHVQVIYLAGAKAVWFCLFAATNLGAWASNITLGQFVSGVSVVSSLFLLVIKQYLTTLAPEMLRLRKEREEMEKGMLSVQMERFREEATEREKRAEDRRVFLEEQLADQKRREEETRQIHKGQVEDLKASLQHGRDSIGALEREITRLTEELSRVREQNAELLARLGSRMDTVDAKVERNAAEIQGLQADAGGTP